MVNPESHRTGRQIGKIGDDRDHFVPAFAPQNQIVRGIMNDHVVGMVGERAHAVSNKKTEPPETKAELPHPICDRRLQNQQ